MIWREGGREGDGDGGERNNNFKPSKHKKWSYTTDLKTVCQLVE